MSSMIWAWRAASALPWLAPLVKNRRWLAWTATIAVAVSAAVACQWNALGNGNTPKFADACLHSDVDTALILKGLHEAPEFGDTLGWWTGVWCAEIPFWRPIPSMVFWMELQVFGHDFRWWGVVSVLFAGALAAAMMWGLEPLFGTDGAAAVVGMTFVSLWVPWHPGTPLTGVLAAWKHQVDLLLGISCFAALGLMGGKRPLLALLPVGLACATKETGFTLLALLPIVAWWRRRRGDEGIAPLRLAGYLACLVVPLAVYRLAAVGYGYGMGTNENWWTRALLYCGGYPVQQVMTRYWYTFSAGALVVATLWLAWRRPRLALVGAPMALATIACALAVQRQVEIITAVTMLLVDGAYVFAAMWWCVMACAAWRFSRHEIILGIAFILLGSGPTFLATQTLEHGRWIGGVGHAILGWAAIRGVWMGVPPVWAALKEGLSEGPEEGNHPETDNPPAPTETETKEG